MSRFVCRNLKYCPEKLRRLSYISLIRSKLEYSSSVWDPHLRKDIHHLEMVQRRAARFIKRDYSYESSVTQMLKDLDLSSLENRRKINKLTVLYKIRNNLLCIKENGYLKRADSRTRDASRNYKLKSAKTELFKQTLERCIKGNSNLIASPEFSHWATALHKKEAHPWITTGKESVQTNKKEEDQWPPLDKRKHAVAIWNEK